MDFKDQLVKLGSARPELRKHIRPVLATLKTSGIETSLGKTVLDTAGKWGEREAQKAADKIEAGLKAYQYGDVGNNYFDRLSNLEWNLGLKGSDRKDYYSVFFNLYATVKVSAGMPPETKLEWGLVVLYDGRELLVTDEPHSQLDRGIKNIVRTIESDIALRNR